MIDVHSSLIQTGVRVATPLALMVGLYLLFAGHNQPGGGFAAGLVFGAVVALRTVAGIRPPVTATATIAGGVLVVAAIAVLPVLVGNVLLDQWIWSVEFPVLGKIKTGTALVFDIGVTAIVVGLVVAVLDGLGGSVLGGTTLDRATLGGVESEVRPGTDPGLDPGGGSASDERVTTLIDGGAR